ncbi:hypothetical protein DL96DRAFT_1589184 [Flagelloscypha sp. PMI_526]|nr:hypothetical protein DL96DRAFT_1589184 [Flagelloscypha sp. PMI_526]
MFQSSSSYQQSNNGPPLFGSSSQQAPWNPTSSMDVRSSFNGSGILHPPSNQNTSNSAANNATAATNYTPGYLLSSLSQPANQSHQAPSSSSPSDALPLMESASRATNIAPSPMADSMFSASSRAVSKRRTMTPGGIMDEDAPPRASVFDLPTTGPSSFFTSSSSQSLRKTVSSPTTATSNEWWPHYFQGLSSRGPEGTTQPTPADGVNSFRIGYLDPADALRAARKSGELLTLGTTGAYYIGVKLSDSSLAPAVEPSSFVSTPMAIDLPVSTMGGGGGGSVAGTPLRLQPASAAFRPKGSTSSPFQAAPAPVQPTASNATPQKSLVGTVGDMLFGW